MGRPTSSLNREQVEAARAHHVAQGLVPCSQAGCPHPVANDSTWADDEVRDVCVLHRQKARNARGACPNCGGTMADVPIINQLTGRPRTQAGVPQQERRCTGCSYVQRERKARRGR